MAGVAESIWDYLRLIDEKGREDKIFLLAGGVAFNLLLAFIPLLVVTISAFAFFLGKSGEESVAAIMSTLGEVLPVGAETEIILRDMLSSAGAALSIGTVAFIWLTTRLFASLRLVLADVFDIEETRNVFMAKLFDMKMSLVSSLFLMSYFSITTYLTIAVRTQFVGEVRYYVLTAVAFLAFLITFLLLYRYLPRKRVRWRTALVGALFTSVMFEVAKYIFGWIAPSLNPGSIYSGAIAAIVVSVVWSYYVALIFILGGEVAQVYDLLRARNVQRVVFE